MSYAIGLSLPKDIPADPDRSLKIIAFGVVLFHLVFITMISMQKYETPVPLKPVQKLVVHTVNLDNGMRVRQSSQKRSAPQQASAAAAIPDSLPEPEIVLTKEIESEPESTSAEIEPEPIPEPEPEVVEEAPPAVPVPKVAKEVKPVKPVVKKETVKKAVPKKIADKPKNAVPKKAADKPKSTTPKTVEKPKNTVPKKDSKAPVKKDAKAPVKKETPKKEPAPVAKIDPKAEALNAKKRELIAHAQASMAKVEKSRSSIAGSGSGNAKNLAIGTVPSTISSLNADSFSTGNGDSSLSVREIGYRNELASRLRMLLKLPEHGDVKIKLKLDKSGKFLSVSIVSAQNNANRKYIEKTLPTLTFPSFGSNFSGHQDYTFSITLSNDL